MDIEAIIDELHKEYTFGCFLKNDIVFFTEWVRSNEDRFSIETEDGYMLDSESIKKLFLQAVSYKNNVLAKKAYRAFAYVPQPDSKNISRTELIERTLKRIKASKDDLTRFGITNKSKELLTLLNDFISNPDAYFPKRELEIIANLDEIRSFLRSKGVVADEAKKFTSYLSTAFTS